MRYLVVTRRTSVGTDLVLVAVVPGEDADAYAAARDAAERDCWQPLPSGWWTEPDHPGVHHSVSIDPYYTIEPVEVARAGRRVAAAVLA